MKLLTLNFKNKAPANYEDILKSLAILTMIIDHVALFDIFSLSDNYNSIFRVIGRITMPVFTFFTGYNFTSRKPSILILLMGIMMQGFLYYMWKIETQNILISIFVSQCYLYLFSNMFKKNNYIAYIHAGILTLLSFFTKNIIDYGTLVSAIMILGYITRKKQKSYKLNVALSVLISLVNTMLTFQFKSYFLLLYLVISILHYLFWVSKPIEEPIKIDLRLISRNALIIYPIHILIIHIPYIIN